VPGKCLHPTHVPQGVLAGLASKLRCALVGYAIEKIFTHPLFHDIKPVRGGKDGSNGPGKEPLDFHMDMSYTKNAPDYVALAALREGPDPNVTTPLVENRRLYDFLAKRFPQDIAVLRDPANWKIYQPESTGGRLTPPMPLLTGDENMVTFWLRVQHERIRPQNVRAEQALLHLRRALTEVETHSLHLGSGEVLVINNYMALHHRSSFKPNFDSDDRLLMRAYYMSRNKNSAILEDRIFPE
jgi:L-asparagine oxygenase